MLSPVGASGGFEPDGRPSTAADARSACLETSRVKVGSFITHRYHSLDQVSAAFAGAHQAADYRQSCGWLLLCALITFTPRTAPTSAPQRRRADARRRPCSTFAVAVDASADVPLLAWFDLDDEWLTEGRADSRRSGEGARRGPRPSREARSCSRDDVGDPGRRAAAGKDHLHRPQLQGPRGREQHAGAEVADHVLEVTVGHRAGHRHRFGCRP